MSFLRFIAIDLVAIVFN